MSTAEAAPSPGTRQVFEEACATAAGVSAGARLLTAEELPSPSPPCLTPSVETPGIRPPWKGVLHQHSRPHGDPPSRPTKRHPGKAAAVSPQLQLLQRSLPPVPALPEPPLGTLLSRGPVVAELCGVVAVSPGTGMRHSPWRRGFPAQSERERRKGRLAAFLLASFHFPLLMLFSLFMAPCLSLEPQQTSLESSANRNKRGRVFSGSSKHPPRGQHIQAAAAGAVPPTSR